VNHIFTKTRIKYFLGLIALVGVLIGGYYLYSYYKDRFVNPYILVVRFNPDITNEEALNMLEKYKPGISTRNPRNYDVPEFATYENFEQRSVQFTIKGWYEWKLINNQLTEEAVVQRPRVKVKIETLEKILAYFFNKSL